MLYTKIKLTYFLPTLLMLFVMAEAPAFSAIKRKVAGSRTLFSASSNKNQRTKRFRKDKKNHRKYSSMQFYSPDWREELPQSIRGDRHSFLSSFHRTPEGVQRKTYRDANLDSGLIFSHYSVPGDGDCSLHALSVTSSGVRREINRREFVERFLEALKQEETPLSVQLKSDIRTHVVSYCRRLTRFNSIPRLCDEIESGENSVRTHGVFRSFVAKALSRSTEFLDIFPGKDLGNDSGTLAAAARLFQLNIRVWEVIPSEEEQVFNVYTVNTDEATDLIDIIHLGDHYERLIPAGANQELESAALEKEAEA